MDSEVSALGVIAKAFKAQVTEFNMMFMIFCDLHLIFRV